MSETLQQPVPNESLRIHNEELAHIGALVTEAAMRSDLAAVAVAHVEQTGVTNPNTLAPGFMVGKGEVTMSNESVYRQVHLAAIGDLAASGIVRNRGTAGGDSEVKARWSDRVFWNSGAEGSTQNLGGRTVIEADKAAAETGWVTADKVKAVYAHDSDGQVKNIIG